MKEISFTIDGDPIPWKRPGKRSFHGNTIIYDAQAKLKEQVRWKIREHYKKVPLSVPVMVEYTFNFPIPKSASKVRKRQMLLNEIRYDKRPDYDNCEKFYNDCLTGLVLEDDCLICDSASHKRYSETPSVAVSITIYTKNDPPAMPEYDEEDEDLDPYDPIF